MSREVTTAFLFAAVGTLLWLYSRVSWMALAGRGALPLWLTAFVLVCAVAVLLGGRRGPVRVLGATTLVVTLLEFPVFSWLYAAHPELEKWFFAVGDADAFRSGLRVASGYAAGAALLFVAGMSFADATQRRGRTPRTHAPDRSMATWPIHVCALVGALLAVLAMRGVVASLGGFEAVVLSMARRREWASETSPMTYQLSLFLCVVPGWFLLRMTELGRVDGMTRAWTIALMVLAFSVVGLSGTRERAVFSGLSVGAAMLVFPQLRRRMWRDGGLRLLLPLAAMVVVGIVILSVLRQGVAGGEGIYAELRGFNRIDVTISGLELLRRDEPLLLGIPFLLFPALVLERVGIEHEVITTPQYLADQLWGLDFGGTPGVPLFLELLLNFGAVGMLLLPLLGLFAGRGLQWLCRHGSATVRFFWGGAFLYLVAFKVWVQNGLSPTLVFVPVVAAEFWMLSTLERTLRRTST